MISYDIDNNGWFNCNQREIKLTSLSDKDVAVFNRLLLDSMAIPESYYIDKYADVKTLIMPPALKHLDVIIND